VTKKNTTLTHPEAHDHHARLGRGIIHVILAIIFMAALNVVEAATTAVNFTSANGTTVYNENSVAWAFTPLQDLQLDAFGVYDPEGDGLSGVFNVGFFNASGNPNGWSTTFNNPYDGKNGNWFQEGDFLYFNQGFNTTFLAGNTYYMVVGIHSGLSTSGGVSGLSYNSSHFTLGGSFTAANNDNWNNYPLTFTSTGDNLTVGGNFQYTVVPSSPVPEPPVADAGADQTVYVGDSVTLNGSGSYDPDGVITGYAWNFGDSTSASGIIVNHVYNSAAAHRIL
jgi:hypothetical protein